MPDGVKVVLDGGDLLHRLSWGRGITYNQVVESYVDYVVRNYGTRASVVFDGYVSGPSTKDATHLRRQNGRKTACDVHFDGEMLICDTKEKFLSNPGNKQRFIYTLAQSFMEIGIEIFHVDGDADCLIVKTALTKATEHIVAVVGRGTDLLVLLLYHFQPQGCNNVYFDTGGKIWDIGAARESLGPHVCKNILFAHALGGCDTTSSLFNMGKKQPVIHLRESAVFRQMAHVFRSGTKRTTQEDIIEAGERELWWLCMVEKKTTA